MMSPLLTLHPANICLKCAVCVEKVSISIRLPIGVLVHSPRNESEASLSLTTDRASSVASLLNHLTLSGLCYLLELDGGIFDYFYKLVGISDI